jgi:hypothetical protein
MANLSHVPHTRDVKAGVNHYDPVHSCIFEVFFTLPIITGVKGNDIALLPEQVTNVSGLGALHKTPTITTKKFYGIDVSFLDRNLDSSYIDFTIKFNLNLREATDNYVLTAFMKWRDVNYSLATGAQYLRPDYLAEKIVIHIANRAGIIWRTIVFYDCILSTISGLEELDITSNEALSLSCTFRSDYWDDYVYAPKSEYTPVKHDHSISSYEHRGLQELSGTPKNSGATIESFQIQEFQWD